MKRDIEKILVEKLKECVNDKHDLDTHGECSILEFLQFCNQQKVLPYLLEKTFETENPYIAIIKPMKEKHHALIDKIIIKAAEIQKVLKEKNLSVVFIKGFVLSNQIYNNSYSRKFFDIDILCKPDELVEVCKVLENLGYKEKLVSDIEVGLSLSDADRESIYGFDAEKQFVCPDFPLTVEVKDDCSGLGYETAGEMLKQQTTIEITVDETDFSFPVLNIQDAYILTLLNVYTNFEAEHGIEFDHNARDLLDVYHFTELFDDTAFASIIRKCKNQKIEGQVKAIYLLVKAFFGAIPHEEAFINLTENVEALTAIDWDIDIFERIFNPAKRVLHFKRATQNKIIQKQPDWTIVPGEITQDDFLNTRFQPEYRIWSYPLFEEKSFFTTVDLFEDKENLYFGVSFSRPANQMETFLCFLTQDDGQKFEKRIVILTQKDKAEIKNNELDGISEITHTVDADGTFKFLIKIPKVDKTVFTKRCYYYCFAQLGFGEGFSPIGQGLAISPVVVDLKY